MNKMTNLHWAVVGYVDVACHLCVIENAAKINSRFLKLQIGEINFSSQSHVILAGKSKNKIYTLYIHIQVNRYP